MIDRNLNSCEDVLRFLVEHYTIPHDGILYFEGDEILAEGTLFDCRSELYICPKYPKYVFLIRKNSNGKSITLGIAKGCGCCIDQIPAITLPKKSYYELVYELTQDEYYRINGLI